MDYRSQIDLIRKTFKRRQFDIILPASEFPEIIVDVPDKWPVVKLAPWYDVHVGNKLHNHDLFKKHMAWMVEEPHVITWNGGDFIENAILDTPGLFEQRIHPCEQFDAAVRFMAPIQHKMAFALPGNHEARTANKAGFDIARHLADDVQVPYFPDYVFCLIRWRGQKFRIVAHHGSGAAATPGGQRNAARKDMPWVSADLYWTGHIHQPIADPVSRTDYDQRTDRMVRREAVVIISPSYLNYFGGYAASKRLSPGVPGLTVAELQPDGDIRVTLHAKGKRV